ncbi:rps12 [Symbiodinium sp. KB8]|nr:rps12 [Symbiodinium sp. KB8]
MAAEEAAPPTGAPAAPVDAAPTTVSAPAAPAKELEPMEALQSVLNDALVRGSVKRGLRESVRALDRKTARLCCLAADCDEASYVQLVKAMCNQNNIPLMEVPAAVDLGQWVGLTKVKADGTAKKAVKCSCAAVADFGKDSEELKFLLKWVSEQ